MKPRWKIVVRDLAIGAVGLAMFGGFLLRELGALEAALVVVSTVAWAGVEYRSDRDAFPDWAYGLRDTLRERTALAVLFTAVVVAVAVAPLMLYDPLVGVYLAGFTGMCLGSVVYRTCYGVVRPVPEPALSRA